MNQLIINRKLIIPFVLLIIFLPSDIEAISRIEELKNLIDEKNKEIKELEEKTEQYMKTIDKLESEKFSLKRQLNIHTNIINNLTVEIKLTDKKIEKLGAEIDKLVLEIKNKEIEINTDKKTIGQLIKIINRLDTEKPLIIFAKNDNLSDFYSEIKYFLAINNSLLEKVKSLKELKNQLNDQKAVEESKKITLINLKTELSLKKELNKSQKNNKNQLLIKTQNQEKQYQKLLKETEKINKEVQEELEILEEKLRLLVDPKSLPPPKSGFFDWPVQGLVTSPYGTRVHPLTDALKFHNGIDIRGAIGTLIKAPYNGKIIAIGDSDKFCWGGAYGKWVVIDHQNNLATMYAHLSVINVSLNQEIKKGDVIGLVGNTGYSTGPHLHFTVYDQRTLDIRPSRVCGPLPYGGSINPLNYL